jgi:L-serine dehydratase
MSTSVFDIFKIGIGPSSSHTVGPMKAARRFAQGLATDGLWHQVRRVQIDLHGSPGATGRGHGSDRAVLLGLEGESPESVNTAMVEGYLRRVRETGSSWLLRQTAVPFTEKTDLNFHWQPLPFHPNGMAFTAFDGLGATLRSRTYYSIGGGFVVDENAASIDPPAAAPIAPALSLHHGHATAGTLPARSPFHQRFNAEKRTGVALRSRYSGRTAANLAGDAGLRFSRVPH